MVNSASDEGIVCCRFLMNTRYIDFIAGVSSVVYCLYRLENEPPLCYGSVDLSLAFTIP